MKEKIEWFQEVLALEPGSKVFFPLAKLYVKTGQADEAIATLRFGLGRQPDFMEARLLLVELLTEQGLESEARQEMEPLAGALKSYPAFWRNWAGSLSAEEPDLASALSLTASHFAGNPLRWSQVIEEGLRSLTGMLRQGGEARQDEAPRADQPTSDRQAAEPKAAQAPSSKDRIRSLGLKAPAETPKTGVSGADKHGIRTRTMANLLASQGDYKGALEIYEELGRTEEAARMRSLLDSEGGGAAARSDEEDAFSFDSTNKLIKTLEKLAARLEARAEPQTA